MFGDIFGPKEKKVEYLELIYDLIFVYIIGRNSSLVQHVENGFIKWDLFLTYVLCTLIVIQIWNFTTFYINRYGSNGIKDHIFIFINMYLLYYMADATRVNWQDYYYRYNIAWLLIILNIALQYYLKLRQARKETPWETVQIKNTMLILLLEGAIILVFTLLYNITGLPLTPVAMIFGVVATGVSGRINMMIPVDFGHLSERAMLYVVFTFGEMIIAISGYFSGNFSFNNIYFSISAFLVVVGLFLSYELFYDHLLDKEMTTNGSGFMIIHIFIIFALNSITTALEFMREEEVAVVPKIAYITAAMLVYYFFLFMLHLYTKNFRRPSGKFIFTVVMVGAAFTALMIIFSFNMYVNAAVSVLFVFAVFYLLIRFKKKTE